MRDMEIIRLFDSEVAVTRGADVRSQVGARSPICAIPNASASGTSSSAATGCSRSTMRRPYRLASPRRPRPSST
ncbi:hypothetical protein BURKHO8Y_30190 [Burkholderia sp. 8Y]|nr:hypothetical protein BURKHO8Y_30190 [Burkholderia sp. 8Y]